MSDLNKFIEEAGHESSKKFPPAREATPRPRTALDLKRGRLRYDYENVPRENIWGIQDDLPDLENLPQPIQDFIEDIKDLSTKEKLDAINAFGNSLLKYEEPLNESTDTNFSGILAKGTGDCDDFAALKATLCRYAGIPEKNIYIIGGKMNVTQDNGDKVPLEHAIAVVADENGNFYALDLGTDNASQLSPDLTYGNPETDPTAKYKIEITDVYITIPADKNDRVETYPALYERIAQENASTPIPSATEPAPTTPQN